ncbi:hypothetical protein PHMEG_00031404 [Phytophthora megakarya]|uniref:Uncharacterized protein n=1 Tax=Phytophthora megakarya TaxID=4795 RepID=A0A225UYP6_9STRA|nr:hypothetical protein PHMEG_00031404 [Phytophthora megakarya]
MDLTFFADKHGVRHQVEMRGKRTMEGIYFKAKDIGRVFESESFLDTIQHPLTQIKDNLATVIPLYQNTTNTLHDQNKPNEFRDWVYKQVFVLAYGTVTQKQEMLSTLCKVDKSFLQAFMKLVPNDLACLYLVDTTMRENGKKVFKSGRSKKVKERFYKHDSAFGDGTILDTVVFVPCDCISEAETLLKQALREGDHFAFNKEQELIILDAESYKSVRSIMRMIADRYNGSMAIQAEVHARELKEQEQRYKVHMKEQENGYKFRIKDLESMIEVLKERIQNAVAGEKTKASVLLVQLTEEKGKVSMLQQQLTSNVNLSTSKLENIKLHQQISTINHAAEIKDRDRLIGELRARINELERFNSSELPDVA